ncbi:hypothetical protein BGZ46_009841 [Entomortierella lignicola]|nr:hypothetical protein BGZ46_009841 [Entomortierella lignicola]
MKFSEQLSQNTLSKTPFSKPFISEMIARITYPIFLAIAISFILLMASAAPVPQ